MTVYKFLNGRQAIHAPNFRYRLHAWQPAIQGRLVPCQNAYHGLRPEHFSDWISSDLFVIESRDEWLLHGSNKLYTRGPVRIIEHLKGWNERTMKLCAIDFVERVLPIFEKRCPNDDRPRLAIQAARNHANGLTSSAEVARAAEAAVRAARAAEAAGVVLCVGAAEAARAAWAAGAAARAAWAAGAAQRATWVAEAASWAAWAAEAAEAAAAAEAAEAARAARAEREWQGQRILDYAERS